MGAAAIVDIDGTLVDTNYHHALAWGRAFARHDLHPRYAVIHRHIGMGGDQLVGEVAGADAEREHGDSIRDAEGELYQELIAEVRPFEGARELLAELGRRGHPVVLASSAKAEEVDHYLDLLDARELVEDWTTSADVDATKPEPELVAKAMTKVGAISAVMIGDTTWDVIAALRAEVKTVALESGGFSESELRAAGAVDAFPSVAELLANLDRTPLR